MTEFNWDHMPAELRVKLLELAGMSLSMQTLKWTSFEDDEKEKLNKALWDKTGGAMRIADR